MRKDMETATRRESGLKRIECKADCDSKVKPKSVFLFFFQPDKYYGMHVVTITSGVSRCAVISDEVDIWFDCFKIELGKYKFFSKCDLNRSSS